MWLFFLLVFVIVSLGVLLSRYKIYFLRFIFFLFFIISAFRSPIVGNDTQDYRDLFINLQTSSIENFTWRYEKGFLLFNKCISYISNDPQILIIAIATLTCLAYYMLIKRYSLIPWISVYLFFTLRYFDLSMNIARQTLALSSIFVAFYFLTKKKFLPFLVFVLLATSFHNTAFIFIIAWFVYEVKDNKKFLTLLSLLTIIGFSVFNYIFSFILSYFPTYSYYLNSSYMDGNTRTATILNILVSFVIILFIYLFKYPKNKINDVMFKLLLIGLSISIISIRFSLLDRVSDYFSVFSIILLPNAIYMQKNKKYYLIICYILIISFFAYSLSILILRPDWNRIYPYEFFFQ
ncbi:EpsG family protein [Enterococcus casseliflavus]|uniref:EpsG family protein n=1 Tax=Enterococcus casseliflavus TaxID=37734 RepID=UPI000763BED1|nr:EpsG family protein [Enterococcus casseliflavus]OJG28871.1 hypothetical protein RU99_GL002143 [Enterococcus casseliflavus]QQU22701.1 EpsG family protein [Enterococcus casseliflavus]STQ30493.1 Uncharacterised protein [Enterococcus casseliflavus]